MKNSGRNISSTSRMYGRRLFPGLSEHWLSGFEVSRNIPLNYPPRNALFESFGYVEILTIFFSTLLEATARNASAPAAAASLGVIIPERVIQHNHKAQGRFGGTGTFPSGYLMFSICGKLRVFFTMVIGSVYLTSCGECDIQE